MSEHSIRKAGAAAALVASGLVAGGVLAGSLTANAASSGNNNRNSTSSSSAAPRQSSDTDVTGAEADKVKAAVTAAHSGVTITTVRKDPDGSYDALGTDANGNNVFYNVSADLKTITANTGHPGGHGPQPNNTPSSMTTTG